MASEKLRRTTVREVCDAYAEGVLDGIEAERIRQSRPAQYDPGTRLQRQLTPDGRTLESLLEVPK